MSLPEVQVFEYRVGFGELLRACLPLVGGAFEVVLLMVLDA